MHHVALPETGTDRAWRDAARGLLAARIAPEAVTWSRGAAEPALLDGAPPPATRAPVKVPKDFVTLADGVVWHRDPERFARLYALLWRLRIEPRLMEDPADAALARLRRMEKAVHRCRHKMRAFLRFREVAPLTAGRRRFAAWFEPTQLTLEPNAEFFARRFGDMDWLIATPDLTARFEGGRVSFAPGAARPDLPEDAAEDLWRTYFANIFNPARVKIRAMTSEMPKTYWKNLPEAPLIPGLIAGAEARVREMAEAAPSLPPIRAERIAERLAAPAVVVPMDDLQRFKAELDACTRCPLGGPATQGVPGEGPLDAPLMVVGEQPGDREDLEGRPFVGPAGLLFDRIAGEAGLDRRSAYVTNAVKHFKFAPRGKRRVHQSPNASEISHCRWWLAQEIERVNPRLILAMGGTAAESVTGSRKGIMSRRGTFEETPQGRPVLLTVHPSYLLRVPDAAAKAAAERDFRADLERAVAWLRDRAA